MKRCRIKLNGVSFLFICFCLFLLFLLLLFVVFLKVFFVLFVVFYSTNKHTWTIATVANLRLVPGTFAVASAVKRANTRSVSPADAAATRHAALAPLGPLVEIAVHCTNASENKVCFRCV